MTRNYIHQTEEEGYSCCILIGLLNAAIYHDKPILTQLGGTEWESLVDKFQCRHGACIGYLSAAEKLGFELIPKGQDNIGKEFPMLITCLTKAGFHASLVVDAEDEGRLLTVVNHDGFHGPVVQKVYKCEIEFLRPGLAADKHYLIVPSSTT